MVIFVDLTGTIGNGCTSHNLTDTHVTGAEHAANEISKEKIKVGDTVRVNFSAKSWFNSQVISREKKERVIKFNK